MPIFHYVFAALSILADAPPAPPTTQVHDAITGIVEFLQAIGGAICIIGIAIGGLMRATSFGNEHKVAQSNTAITCAVIGLGVLLLSTALGTWLGGLIPH